MIKKIKASRSEKIIFIFIILLATFSFGSFLLIKDTLVQTGDLEFGKRENINYGKIGTGKSGLGTINSEVDSPFDFKKGSVALARTQKYNTEDSQFFIVLRDEPLYETEYTPIGRVIYGLKALEKIKYLDKSQYVLRPDYIESLRMLIN